MPRQLRKIQAFLEMPDFCKSPWQICPTWMYVNFKEILIQSHFIVPLMSQVRISDNTGSWNHTTFTRDIHKSPCIVLSTKCCLHVIIKFYYVIDKNSIRFRPKFWFKCKPKLAKYFRFHDQWNLCSVNWNF